MSAPKPAAVRKDSRKRQGSRAQREPERRTQKKTQKADGRKSAAIPCVFVSTGGTNGSQRNPIKDACPCSRMIQPAIRTAAAGNPSGSSMPILMGLMDSCYGDCLRPFQPEVFLCSSGLALPGYGIHSLPAPGTQEGCTDGFLNGAYSLHWAGPVCSDPEAAVP